MLLFYLLSGLNKKTGENMKQILTSKEMMDVKIHCDKNYLNYAQVYLNQLDDKIRQLRTVADSVIKIKTESEKYREKFLKEQELKSKYIRLNSQKVEKIKKLQEKNKHDLKLKQIDRLEKEILDLKQAITNDRKDGCFSCGEKREIKLIALKNTTKSICRDCLNYHIDEYFKKRY